MGIFGALNTAVSGLRAQSYAMENISGNIANSQTVGFKRTETGFVDLVADRPRPQALSGSVRGFAQQTISVQGDIRPTSINTNMAINGSGFFSVSQMSGFRDGRPLFSETNLFTRRGDFQLDKDGFLVNGAGMYLRGDSINTQGLVTSTNGILRITDTTVPARATQRIDYGAVLPLTAGTNVFEATGTDDRLFPNAPPDFSPFTSDPRFTAAPNPQGVIPADRSTDFLSRTISGGSILVYNDAGAPIDVQIRWGKTGDDTWTAFYQNNAAATGTQTMWTALAEVQFDTNGRVVGTPQQRFAEPVVNGQQLPAGIAFVIDPARTSQFSVPNNLVQGLAIGQDGYASGVLQDLEVTSDGRISGIYSNGQSFAIARVSIAQFASPNMLKARDGGTFEATVDSGNPIFSPEGARLVAGSVEQSNSDIAEEFTRLIVTQQAYTANTRVVTTAQQMMEQTINMVR